MDSLSFAFGVVLLVVGIMGLVRFEGWWILLALYLTFRGAWRIFEAIS